MEKIGTVAYKLKLPATAKIHDVFHVSLLKKKLGEKFTVEDQLPPIFDTRKKNWIPAAVLETRMVKRRGEAAAQWLIQWQHATVEEATWEYAEDITTRFPDFKH